MLVGYFEEINSERRLEWRCADCLSLREFLRLGAREPVPDHSWLSRTRARLPLKVRDAVFTWVLRRLAERGLVKGERTGVDASTMEANAAMRAIVRRETGEGYREMLTRMAKASDIETPTAENLIRLDRARKGKRLSNTEWESPTDPAARIAKLKDGRTHLAHKPKHAVDLDTGAVVAAEMHHADRGDTATLPGTLDSAAAHLVDNRTRPLSGVPPRGVPAAGGDRGARLRADPRPQRAWLRGRENLHKRYLIHASGYNLDLLMGLLTGAGTRREFQARVSERFAAVVTPTGGLFVLMTVGDDDQTAAIAFSIEPDQVG